MITQCPACNTLFRVVPDQLRLAEGWVRCGDCGEVFDASEHLQNLADDAMPAVPAVHAESARHGFGPSGPAPLERTDDKVAVTSRPVAVDVLLEDLPVNPATSEPTLDPTPVEPPPAPAFTPRDPVAGAPVAQSPDVPLPSASAPPLAAAHAGAVDAELPSSATPEPAGLPPATDDLGNMSASREVAVTGAPRAGGEPAWYAQFKQAFDRSPDPGGDDGLDAPIEEMSFVRRARDRAAWESNTVRAVLGVVALVLGVLLLLQVVMHQRDRIAAQQPQLRPLLEWLCRPMRCTVQPLRQIDAVVIDHSSFNRQGSDSYRLSVGLRNSSPWPVAAPWLELTLTDAGDQPVLRRVLSDRELGLPPVAVIAGGSEWSATLTLSVTADANTTRITGYRLLAFYP